MIRVGLLFFTFCGVLHAQELPFLVGGIQVNEPSHEVWADGLQQAGLNTVAVTAYAKQGNWDTDHIWWEEDEPAVVSEIVAAKAAGLRVVFIARVALDHAFPENKHFWHGSIMPQTDEQLASWFAQYTRFVVKWAHLCDSLDVDVFGIGSEMRVLTATLPTQKVPRLEGVFLNPIFRLAYQLPRWQHRQAIESSEWWQGQGGASFAAQLRTQMHAQVRWARQVTYANQFGRIDRLNARRAKLDSHWRALIAEVRHVYHGQMTYAANFDNYHRVGFWDALDIVGINAYFPLTESTEAPTVEQTAQSWETIAERVSTTMATHGVPNHPVLFTEIGYIRRAGTLVAPWSGFGYAIMPKALLGHTFHLWEQEPQRLSDRATAMQGLAQVYQRGKWPQLRGLLYWKLTTLPAMGEIEPFALVLDTGDPLEDAFKAFDEPLTEEHTEDAAH